jgi:hypothetical protein
MQIIDRCSKEEWENFVKNIKTHDVVGIQVFHPEENDYLGTQTEAWRLHKAVVAKWDDDKYWIFDGNNTLPFNKEGMATYWGSEKLHGVCFPSRVIPWNYDTHLAPPFESLDLDRPIYEPNYRYRMKFLVKNGAIPSEITEQPHHYSKRVCEGDLVTVYTGNAETLYELNKLNCFLYSEVLASR